MFIPARGWAVFPVLSWWQTRVVAGGDSGAGPGAGLGRRWDVALSFAGAQREYVERAAAVLKARGVRCFYDADEQVELWGRHLAEELPRIYAEESAAVVVFVSADYAAGGWARLECRAAFSRAVAEAGVYVLPARFDDSELPGLLDDVVSVDLRRYTPEQFADLVTAKLDGLAASPPGGLRAQAGAGRPLAEVTDPFALEVHHPVQPEGAVPGLPVLPVYVSREHDTELGQVVQAATEGHSGIAVLVGGSSTGKTRACWEALARLRDQESPWRLWHPIDPSRPDAALRELPRIGPRTVVWLNEAQFYLDPAEAGLGEQVAAGLRELLREPARAPVLVLATLWPTFWDTLTTRPPGGADPHAQARELLAGHDITVPAAFTPDQVAGLAGAGDVRLALAAESAEGGQVIQFLAGAPELLARYRNAPPAAVALINAATDARRLGMGAGLPQAFLEAAAAGYLTDAEWEALSEDWLDQALAYTVVPCKGVRGPLTRIRPRPAGSSATRTGFRVGDEELAGSQVGRPGGPLYRLADYLDQYGRAHRKDQVPPAGFWAAAAAYASPGDQAALGDAASARGLYRAAVQLHRNAAASGNLHAAFYLSNPPPCLRGDSRLASWAAAHAPLDDPYAIAQLLHALRKPGAHDQAAALLRRDPAAHASLDSPDAVAQLLHALGEAGAHEQVTALLARDPAGHVFLDAPYGVAELLGALRAAGAHGQVTALLARDPAGHVSPDVGSGVAELLGALWEAGAHEQVTALADRAAASPDAPGAVAVLLVKVPLLAVNQQVTALPARDPAAHASLDAPGIVAELLVRLRAAGAHGQVTALADRAAASPDAPGAVAVLLVKVSLLAVNQQVTVLPSGSLDHRAVLALLDALRAAGAHEQVTALLARDPAAHASLDAPGTVAWLLDALRAAGAHEQVTALADRAAASPDDPGAVAALLVRPPLLGAHEQVTALLARDPAGHVSLDAPYAVAWLLRALGAAGAHEQVTALLARDPAGHVSLDAPYAVAKLLDALRAAGAHRQVTALADRAAASVSLDDPGAVAWLLDALRAAGAHRQVTTLLARDPAAHALLDDPYDPYAVAGLLDALRAAGAHGQVTALADRAAASVSLDDPYAVAKLLDALRAAGAHGQVTALTDRLPTTGLFGLFLGQQGRADQFRFGREPDGTPAAPWGWEDLYLWPAPRSRWSRRNRHSTD